jgi:hypothetical protein
MIYLKSISVAAKNFSNLLDLASPLIADSECFLQIKLTKRIQINFQKNHLFLYKYISKQK